MPSLCTNCLLRAGFQHTRENRPGLDQLIAFWGFSLGLRNFPSCAGACRDFFTLKLEGTGHFPSQSQVFSKLFAWLCFQLRNSPGDRNYQKKTLQACGGLR